MQEHIDIQRRETFREGRAVLRERREKARVLKGLDLDDGNEKKKNQEKRWD
jgi:hypothetical protein